MDTTLAASIIIMVIAIIPGIWALISQTKKSGIQTEADMHALQVRARVLETYVIDKEDKSYKNPIIVQCEHCNSLNTITSLECIKCGAPLNREVI